MRKKYLHCFFILTFVLLPSIMAYAEESEDLNFHLEQVVVTTTKIPTQIKDTSAIVEVLTAADLKKQNVQRIGDALKLLPGIYVRQPKGLMGNADGETIIMRGFINDTRQGGQYIAFLIDGQPISNNGIVNASNLPIENIERIEVIKGPSSALYGSHAMGGVINIITKEKPENATALHLTVGEMKTKIDSISNSGSAGKLNYFLYAKQTESDGYITDFNYLTAPPGSLKAKYPGKNGMDNESYNAKLTYHFDEKSKLSLTAGRNNYTYFWEYKPDMGNRDETSWALSYENQLDERNTWKFHYTEHKEDRKSISSLFPGYSVGYAEAKFKQIEMQDRYQLSKKDSLTIGYVYKEDKLANFKFALKDWDKKIADSDKNSFGKTNSQALYIQNEHHFDDQFTLYIGGRYDVWRFKDAREEEYRKQQKINTDVPDRRATNFSPKIALTYQLSTKLTLRTSVGKAFRAPEVHELIGSWENPTLKYISNASLEPEESTNYEIGADYQFDKDLLGRVSVFMTDFDNRITETSRYDATINKRISHKINADKSKIKGIELGLNKRWDERWTGFINYTYTDAKIKENRYNPELEGKQIDYIPKNMFNFGINYDQNHWRTNLTGNYVSDPCEDRGKGVAGVWDSYFVMDLSVSYKFNENSELSLRIENLLDREYFSSLLAQPRTTYLEFSQKF